MYKLHYTTKPLKSWLVVYHYSDAKIEDLFITSDFIITKFVIDDHCFDSIHRDDLPYLWEHIKDRLNYMLYQIKKDNDMLWNFEYFNVNDVI